MIISYVTKAERHIMRASGIVAAKAVKALKRAGYSVSVYPDYLSNIALTQCNKGYDIACNQEEKTEEIIEEKEKENKKKIESVNIADIQAVFNTL